jgi:cytochrome c biogenesis protein CcmG/thiol:disulfide interchange protein DsbE
MTSSEQDPAIASADTAAAAESGHRPSGRKKWIILIGAFGPLALIAALLIWGTVQGGGRPGGIFVNISGGEVSIDRAPAPDFTLTTFDGSSVTLSEHLGKVVFIDFWSSWCPPCRQEAPALKAVSDAMAGEDVAFIGIDVWENRPGEGRTFARRSGWDYPSGIDQDGAITIDYGVKGLPEKFFVDQDGNLVRKFIGPITADELTFIINDMLANPPSQPSALLSD